MASANQAKKKRQKLTFSLKNNWPQKSILVGRKTSSKKKSRNIPTRHKKKKPAISLVHLSRVKKKG